jgi:hypothetical protein
MRLTLLAVLLAMAPRLASQTAPSPRNLQVLPAGMTRAQVAARMGDIAGGLGVQCLYCHEGTSMRNVDFASDAKETKRTAREMMRFMERVNQDLAAVMPDRGEARIDCVTCHRGAPRPRLLEDSLATVVRVRGVEAALATYDTLRSRYYGRFVFDFGQRPLNVLAERLAAGERPADALRVLELNGQHFPASWDVPYEMGRLWERMGQPARAIERYRRTLELLPTHSGALARLAALDPG